MTSMTGLNEANADSRAVIAWSFILNAEASFITAAEIAAIAATIGFAIKANNCLPNAATDCPAVLNTCERLIVPAPSDFIINISLPPGKPSNADQ